MAPNAPRTLLPTIVPTALRKEAVVEIAGSALKPVADAEPEAMPVAEEEAAAVEAEKDGMMV